MNKHLTSNQLLLFGLAGTVLLIAAFSLILLQDPSAPLPFAPPPATITSTPPPSETRATATDTPIPTRQTSYTPFAFTYTPSSLTPSFGTLGTATPPSSPPVPTVSPKNTTYPPNPSKTISPGGTTTAQLPTRTATSTHTSGTPGGTTPSKTTTPTPTNTITPTSTYSGASPTPTLTPTLMLGEIGVTGRMLLNGTPMANVVVSFEDDIPPRQSATNPGGHYWFTTLAPGIPFILTFTQSDNPQLTPASAITSLARVRGTLPLNVNPIDLPDFEISLNVNNMLFELQEPMDGAAYSASATNAGYPVPFIWTLYGLGGSYHIELGPHGSDQPIWTSDQTALIYNAWDGTLNNGSHITEGTYWWRVGVTKSLGNHVVVIFTQPWDIFFNP